MRNVSLMLLPVLVGACSSAPIIPVPPAVKVSQFDSLLITRKTISLQAKVVINNETRRGLKVEKVDWVADLHDNPVLDGTFDQVKPLRSREQQTITLPFQIPMSKLAGKSIDALAEEGLRFRFRGSVHAVGFEPVPFEAAKTIPLPKVPIVSVQGVDGHPLQGFFTAFLVIQNNNDFPMTVADVDSHLNVNRQEYELSWSKVAAKMEPGGTGKVAVMTQQTSAKNPRMAWSTVRAKKPVHFEIRGSVDYQTPHGVIQVPLKVSSE